MVTKRFSEEFKIEAIKRVLESEGSQNKVAKELGIPPSTLSGWVMQYKKNPSRSIEGSFKPSEAELELKRLRKQNRDLQDENEILKKAAAYFAKNQK